MRKLSITLYQLHELSPTARAVAIQEEREHLQPSIQEMIEALFVQELAKVGATLDGLIIDWEEKTVTASVSTSQADPTAISMTENLIEELTETAQKELGTFLSDAYAQANIEGDALEYLEDGRVWIYGGDD